MTNIHLAFDQGNPVGHRIGDLPEGSFYLLGGQLFRLLVNPNERHEGSDTVTSLAMENLDATFHHVGQAVTLITLKRINIEVEAE